MCWAGSDAQFSAHRRNLELALVITQPTSRPRWDASEGVKEKITRSAQATQGLFWAGGWRAWRARDAAIDKLGACPALPVS